MLTQRRIRLLALGLALAISLGAAGAQTFPFDQFEKVLIPMAIRDVHGASGSVWSSELWVHNEGNALVSVIYPYSCPIFCVPQFGVSPSEGKSIPFFPSQVERPGQILYLDPEGAGNIRFWSRVFDRSREALSRGAEIPIVRERELSTTKLSLFPIPVDPSSRLTIHFYDVDSRSGARLALRLYPTFTLGPAVSSREITLRSDIHNPLVDDPFLAGYARLDGLSSFPPLQGCPDQITCRNLRLEIESLTPGLRFWAYATLINNDIQHVTTITPQ